MFSLLSSEGITSSQYVGIALNSDGTLLAASNVSHHTISVFTLPGGAHLRDIGGKTVFKSPGKICLAPNGNILVAEEAGRRVQECTFEGVHVRTVGKDLNARVWGIAASPAHVSVGKHLIAVGKEDGGAPVVLFDFKSGEKLREFDTEGKGMRGIFGLRVSHAGQILVLDSNNSRVRSLYFHSCATSRRPYVHVTYV